MYDTSEDDTSEENEQHLGELEENFGELDQSLL